MRVSWAVRITHTDTEHSQETKLLALFSAHSAGILSEPVAFLNHPKETKLAGWRCAFRELAFPVAKRKVELRRFRCLRCLELFGLSLVDYLFVRCRKEFILILHKRQLTIRI